MRLGFQTSSGELCGFSDRAINLRYGAKQGYPYALVDDISNLTNRPAWCGLSSQQTRLCSQGIEMQEDFWSCAANSAARVAVGLTGRPMQRQDYMKFRDATPMVDLKRAAPGINSYFHDETGRATSAIIDALPRFGPDPGSLAGYIATSLGLQVGVMQAESLQACKTWLVNTIGAACSAVILMCYGDFAMHYVGAIGIDQTTLQVALVDTNGDLVMMDLDVLEGVIKTS